MKSAGGSCRAIHICPCPIWANTNHFNRCFYLDLYNIRSSRVNSHDGQVGSETAKREKFMRLSITDKDLMNRQPVESVDGLQLLGETHGLHRVDASVVVEVQVQARRHDLDVGREDLGVRFEVIETPVLGNFPFCKRLEGMSCCMDCSV